MGSRMGLPGLGFWFFLCLFSDLGQVTLPSYTCSFMCRNKDNNYRYLFQRVVAGFKCSHMYNGAQDNAC